jgi:hypothetical protein
MTDTPNPYLSGGEYSRLHFATASLQAANGLESAEETQDPSVRGGERQAAVKHGHQGSVIREQRYQQQ